MTEYNILFKGDIWDILNSDYENYFYETTPFEECEEIKIY